MAASSRCNRVIDCVDGSDETEAMCGREPPTDMGTRSAVVRPPGSCAIPTIQNGRVISPVTNEIYSSGQFAENGESLAFACLDGALVGSSESHCINGSLLMEPPRCEGKN